jgi:DNA-binding NarL/FixJ family response regulator
MPKKKSTSKDRQASRKHLPSSPDEAIDWLQHSIRFLCGEQSDKASKNRLRVDLRICRRFIGNVLRAWLKSRHKDNQSLASLIGLTQPVSAKAGRPPISDDTRSQITRMLVNGFPHKEIAKALGVSKRTVDRASQEWNAITWEGPQTTDLQDLSKIPEGQLSDTRQEMLDEIVQDLDESAAKVPNDRRTAMIKGAADTIPNDTKLFSDSDKRTPEERAWLMAANGHSVEQIAQELNTSPSNAGRLVRKARLARHRDNHNTKS